MKKVIVLLLVVGLLVGLGFLLFSPEEEVPVPGPAPEEPAYIEKRVIGTSVEGREIVAHTFGNGENHLLFVGAIHGGYEWNTALLAYQLIEFLQSTPGAVPEDVAVSVIPVLNPDGLHAIVGTTTPFFGLQDVPVVLEETFVGRFNANAVDLNRNFDCNWAPESTWRGETVSGGTGPFSEPEAQTLKGFVSSINPKVAVFYHSIGDGVYSSACNEGVLPETETVMNIYSQASGYPAQGLFDAYPITGDAEGWLATLGIPGLTIELTSREDIQWAENRAGVLALIEYYSNK